MANSVPIVREFAATQAASTATSLTLTTSGNVLPGDLILVFHTNDFGTMSQSGTSINTITGVTWTYRGGADAGTNLNHIYVYTGAVTTAGAKAITVNNPAAYSCTLTAYVFSDHGGYDTMASIVDTTANTLQTIPDPTASVANDYYVACFAQKPATNYTAPSGMTKRTEADSGGNTTSMTATKQLSSSGATSTGSATVSTAAVGNCCSVSVLIKPPAVNYGTRFTQTVQDGMESATDAWQSSTPLRETAISGFTTTSAMKIAQAANGVSTPGGSASAPAAGAQRTEQYPNLAAVTGIGTDGMIDPGDAGYFGLSVKLDATYPVGTTNWQLICQWKNDGSGSPPCELSIGNGVLYLDGNSGGWKHNICQIVAGERYNITVGLTFTESSSTSLISVWVNGTQFLNAVTPLAGQQVTSGAAGLLYTGVQSYWKVGSYRYATTGTPASTLWYGAVAYDPTRSRVDDYLAATMTSGLITPGSPITDIRTGQAIARLILSAGGAGPKVGKAPVDGRIRLSGAASGPRTTSGSGSARLRLSAAGGGSKLAQGAGEARIRTSWGNRGSKTGIGIGWSASMILTPSAAGLKRGIGDGFSGPIVLSTYARIPPPIPIFTGRPLPEDPLPMANTRYLVQNVLTGAWLHTDLPLSDDQVTITLSGPGEITGKVTPEMADLKTADGTPLLRSWGHVVYLEMDGEIRAAGLVTEDSYDDQTQTLTCTGISSYPKLVPYLDNYKKYDVDPLQVVVDMWAYVQGFQNGNLGVSVERMGDSGVRLGAGPKQAPSAPRGFNTEGTAPDPAAIQVLRTSVSAAVWERLVALGYLERAGETNALYVPQPVIDKAKADVLAGIVYTAADTEIDPYAVDWWDVKACGDVIDDAIKATPADFIETFRWNTPRTFVYQGVLLAYPRLGRRRDDLRFVTGENIVDAPELAFDADGYATMVIGIGAGEGSAALRETAEVIQPGVLRKPYVYRNSKITDRAELKRIVAQQLTLRSGFGGQEITRVIVSASHDNAKFGAYNVGDDIFVQVNVPHWGWLTQWGRIISMTLDRESDLVELELRRSDSFYYGREVETS